MTVLVLGLVVFFLVHSVSIVSESLRERAVERIGEGPWKGLYSLVSIAGFVLIVWGYGIARQESVVLYTPPAWLRHLAMLLLAPVFPLLLAAYLPGRIKSLTKHPMLAAIKLWAFAHLLANGMLADALLFGSFLGWAVMARVSIKHRHERPVPGAPPSKVNDIVAMIAGLAFFGAIVGWLHTWVIGVPLIAGVGEVR